MPGCCNYNQWGSLKQAQASWSDRMMYYCTFLQALTDMLSTFFTLVSAIHTLYFQLKWMRGDLFIFWHDMQTWQFQFMPPQSASAHTYAIRTRCRIFVSSTLFLLWRLASVIFVILVGSWLHNSDANLPVVPCSIYLLTFSIRWETSPQGRDLHSHSRWHSTSMSLEVDCAQI